MEPPPLPPLPTIALASTTPAAAAATAIPPASSMHLNYPDSVESSPPSRIADTFDEPLPPVPGAKLRLMCSYGGHIMPRPHDKVLCYVGGETRLVVVDRHSSLSVLCTRLSRTLLNSRAFTLKYQLPDEDLDSLVTVTTDEDLDNMIEEYERISASSVSSGPRIRLFLFYNKPETAASMGALLADAKSETWFVDALNGSMLLPRGMSDSAAMDCLLHLDSDVEAQGDGGADGENKQAKNDATAVHDVQHSTPDSPMLENTSSFGSSSSTPSMANLPPIRVRVQEGGSAKIQDHKVGNEEQLAQISFPTNMHKPGDGFGAPAALPPHPAVVAATVTVAPVATINPAGGSSESLNRMLSDDERSDHGVPTGFRKPPLPLQPVQQKAGGAYNLPSPDSVASDASASSFSKPMYHQEQVHVVSSPNNNVDASIPSSQVQIQQVQDSGYALPPHPDHHQQQQQQQSQQQFVHTSMHYIPHPAPVPMPSYYPVYAPPSQQQHSQPVDQQYPVYVLPVAAQPQPYMNMQSNIHDASIVASSRPLTTPNPLMVNSSSTHKDAVPPIYPTKAAPATTAKTEMAAPVYRTAVTSTPMVQVSSNQFQQQYMGFPQLHHPSQSIAIAPATTANYGYEYANPTHDQMYYTQHQATPLPPQYQTMTQAVAAAALVDASQQIPADNTKPR
ncbi:hypothetical protein SLA2020_224550 [Shorea laevis]